MNENYRDEARVEHMQRAIKKIRQQTDFPGWEESVGRLAATIEPVKMLPPNVADFD